MLKTAFRKQRLAIQENFYIVIVIDSHGEAFEVRRVGSKTLSHPNLSARPLAANLRRLPGGSKRSPPDRPNGIVKVRLCPILERWFRRVTPGCSRVFANRDQWAEQVNQMFQLMSLESLRGTTQERANLVIDQFFQPRYIGA